MTDSYSQLAEALGCDALDSHEGRLAWARRLRGAFQGGSMRVAMRRVVCAAIRASDGTVLLGIRHYSPDMRAQIDARKDGWKFAHIMDEGQGFVDQHGVFMTREEAFRVAHAAWQITNPDACGVGLDGEKLYSEGLY